MNDNSQKILNSVALAILKYAAMVLPDKTSKYQIEEMKISYKITSEDFPHARADFEVNLLDVLTPGMILRHLEYDKIPSVLQGLD